jgi:hypothetical protein
MSNNSSVINVSWVQLKQFADDREVSIQFIENDNSYILRTIDGPFILGCELENIEEPSQDSDQYDFEQNYKPSGNGRLDLRDADGAIRSQPKYAASGWLHHSHYIEFQTSQLNGFYNRDYACVDRGFITAKYYDDEDTLLTTQQQLDTDCVKTVIDWEPDYDYEIRGGAIRILTSPLSDARLWVVAVPDVAEEYGGSIEFIGGLNIRYLDSGQVNDEDSRVTKLLSYNAQYHSNKLRFIVTHAAGDNIDIMISLKLFKAPG